MGTSDFEQMIYITKYSINTTNLIFLLYGTLLFTLQNILLIHIKGD